MSASSAMTSEEDAPDRALVGGVGWVATGSFVVGGVNYVFALALTALLDVADYSVFAGGQALILIAGSAAAASIPWVLASGLVRGRFDREARESVLWFAVVSNGILGVAAGMVLWLVATQFAPLQASAIVGASGMLIFWASTTIGWLQGLERFREIAALRVVEVVIKAGVGLVLVVLGARSAGALAGFMLGAVVVFGYGAAITHSHWAPSISALRARDLWFRAVAMGSIQTLVALLASAGTLAVVLLPSLPGDAASYQVAALLGRIPAFLAGAIALVSFPLMSHVGARSAGVTRSALAVYLRISVPFGVVLALMPKQILQTMFPIYGDLDQVLALLAATGVLIGIVALLATSHQAAGRFKGTVWRLALLFGLQAIGLVIGWLMAGVRGMALGELVGVAIGTAGLLRWSRPTLHLAWRIEYVQVAFWAALAVALFILRGQPIAWLVVVALAAAAVVYQGFRLIQRAES